MAEEFRKKPLPRERREPREPREPLAMEPRAIRERHGRHLERLEALARKVREKRASAYEAAIRHAEQHPPAIAEMKEDPKVLRRAIARGQVKRIARVASPTSKDTGGLFTAGGARYAVTDLYRPTARERAGLLHERATKKVGGFWEEHKTKFVLGAVGLTALYLLYVTAARAKERSAAGSFGRSRHLAGYYRASLPGHSVGWWPEEQFSTGAGDSRFAWTVRAGAPYWLGTEPSGPPDGVLRDEWGIYAGGAVGSLGEFTRVDIDSNLVWVKSSDLRSTEVVRAGWEEGWS